MANGRTDPVVGFMFGLEFGGELKGLFKEAKGLTTEFELITHKSVDAKGRETLIQMPGRQKPQPNIELSRGFDGSTDLKEWMDKVQKGDIESARKTGSIVVFNQSMSEVARWNFEGAWPVKIDIQGLKADANDIVNETVVLAVERMERAK